MLKDLPTSAIMRLWKYEIVGLWNYENVVANPIISEWCIPIISQSHNEMGRGCVRVDAYGAGGAFVSTLSS